MTAFATAPLRVLHTGDWHLNHRLDRVPFHGFLRDAIEQIAGYCAKEGVDVLVVAGDLFSGREGREQLKESVGFLKKTFGPLLKDGLTILTSSATTEKRRPCSPAAAASMAALSERMWVSWAISVIRSSTW